MDSHCLDFVRQHDKDRFLATLFAPEAKQPDLFALIAFDVEISRIHRLVSDSQIGEIRLQWWRDAVEAIFRGEPQDHPIAKALGEAVQRCLLPQSPLIDLIDAHRLDLYAEAVPAISDLEGYLGETCSASIQLTCLILAPDGTGRAAEASGLAGVAYGLARLLAELPARRNVVPPGLAAADLARLAARRWEEAAVRISGLDAVLKSAFLAPSLTPLYLRRAQRFADDGFSVPQWRTQWKLWRNSKVL